MPRNGDVNQRAATQSVRASGPPVDVSWYPAAMAMSWRLLTATASRLVIPSGIPVYVFSMRICSRCRRACGDLYLTGIQLARGYLGRPDLTASRFIADHFCAGEPDVPYRRCGALAGFRRGGVHGAQRRSAQIRGQRIELGEIDRVMQTLPDVERAVAHACVFNQAKRRRRGRGCPATGRLIWCHTPVCRWIYRLAGKITP